MSGTEYENISDAEYLERLAEERGIPALKVIAGRIQNLERVEFEHQNAGALLNRLNRKISSQREEITRLHKAVDSLKRQLNPPGSHAPRNTFAAQCDGKLKHESVSAAKRAVKSMRREGKDGEGRLQVYQCDYCGLYHVGRARSKVFPVS